VPAGARAAASPFLSAEDISEVYRERAGTLNGLARERGQSLAQLALQWVLRRPEVTSALIGASSTWQLDHNVRATEFPPLTEQELALIDQYGGGGAGTTWLVGSADDVAAALRKYRELGVTHFVLSDTPYKSEVVRVGDQLLSRLREPDPA